MPVASAIPTLWPIKMLLEPDLPVLNSIGEEVPSLGSSLKATVVVVTSLTEILSILPYQPDVGVKVSAFVLVAVIISGCEVSVSEATRPTPIPDVPPIDGIRYPEDEAVVV